MVFDLTDLVKLLVAYFVVLVLVICVLSYFGLGKVTSAFLGFLGVTMLFMRLAKA
jgi:hypothetical protein